MGKYKLLVNSSNPILFRDLFMNIPDEFVCLSTSAYWDDIKGHCKMYEPDAFVYVIEENDTQYANIFRNLKESLFYADIPIIAITTEDVVRGFDAMTAKNVDHVIKRPINITNLVMDLRSYLSGVKSEKERKEINQQRVEAALKILEAPVEKKTILVVDDDKNVLMLLKSALEKKYNVVTMITGKIAEKYLESKTCDLILLDYQMPVETGPQVYEKIKKIESAKDIPIVFLTGVAEKEKIAEVLSLKPQGYLLKPVDTSKLIATIENVLK